MATQLGTCVRSSHGLLWIGGWLDSEHEHERTRDLRQRAKWWAAQRRLCQVRGNAMPFAAESPHRRLRCAHFVHSRLRLWDELLRVQLYLQRNSAMSDTHQGARHLHEDGVFL